jgi:TetR/AcrR family transcriptional repressor of nem operon
VPRRTIPPTRDRLIQSAADLLSRKGFAATSVDELCRRAAAQKGSFYHYFRSKTDLAVAAVQFHWEALKAEVFEPIDRSAERGLQRLNRLVEALDARQRAGSVREETLGSPIGALGQEAALLDHRIRDAVQAAFDEQCRFLHQWLEEAWGERQISSGDNLIRARQVLAFLEGALLLAKVAGDPGRFRDLCAILPTVAGRNRPARPAPGTPPELL